MICRKNRSSLRSAPAATVNAPSRFLTDNDVDYDFIDVDLQTGQKRTDVIEEVKKHNPRTTFPTILIGGTVIVGFKEEGNAAGAGDLMTPKQLHEQLKKVQEPKGYFFSRDLDAVMCLMEALLFNKDRYGYMACPCRLALGRSGEGRGYHLPLRVPRAGRGRIR